MLCVTSCLPPSSPGPLALGAARYHVMKTRNTSWEDTHGARHWGTRLSSAPQHLYRVCAYAIRPVPLETPEQVSAFINEDLFIYLLVLVHVSIEPEKSHDLSSASWRLREASGIVWNPKNHNSADLRPRTAEGREHWCLGSGSQAKGESNLPLSFCSIQAPNKLDGAHPHYSSVVR